MVSQACFSLTHKAAPWLRAVKADDDCDGNGSDRDPCSFLRSFLSTFFLASYSFREKFNSLLVSFTNPLQAPFSHAMSCQSRSIPHLFRFLRTKSFHRLFWLPVEHLPTCNLHTKRHWERQCHPSAPRGPISVVSFSLPNQRSFLLIIMTSTLSMPATECTSFFSSCSSSSHLGSPIGTQ